jgi:hypothetical protein
MVHLIINYWKRILCLSYSDEEKRFPHRVLQLSGVSYAMVHACCYIWGEKLVMKESYFHILYEKTAEQLREISSVEASTERKEQLWRKLRNFQKTILIILFSQNLNNYLGNDQQCLCKGKTTSNDWCGCDKCGHWFHKECIKLSQQQLSEYWECNECTNLQTEVEKIPTRQLYTIGQLRNRLNKCKVDLAGCKSKVDYQKRQLVLSMTELGTDWEDSRGYYKTVLKKLLMYLISRNF